MNKNVGILQEGTDLGELIYYDRALEDYSVFGNGGDDLITQRSYSEDTTGLVTYIDGGDGDDRLDGRDGKDTLNGGNDDDILYGFGGNDKLYGGNGVDTLYGEDGNDTLLGNNGDDRLYGGYGDDFMAGGRGQDSLVGGEGKDTYVLNRSGNTDYFDLAEANDVQDAIKIKLHAGSGSMSAVVDSFDASDRISVRAYGSASYDSSSVVDDGFGNALLYIEHDQFSSKIQFNGVSATFIKNRLR